MTPAIIASLLAQYGMPLVQYFVQLYQQGNNPLTPAQLAAVISDVIQLSQYRSVDSLTAAGIKIVDGKVVPL